MIATAGRIKPAVVHIRAFTRPSSTRIDLQLEFVAQPIDDTGGVATITLDQPDTRNALSMELLDELLSAFETARDDDSVRCVVLTSSRDRVFSSGANLGGFAGDVPLVHKHFAAGSRFVRLFRLLGELGKPTICAANGHVLAGALGIALACDLVIAKEEAEFGTPEINVGAFPFMIMALIYRNVPRKKTNELLLLGERLTAWEAAEAGMVWNLMIWGRRRQLTRSSCWLRCRSSRRSRSMISSGSPRLRYRAASRARRWRKPRTSDASCLRSRC